MRMKSEVPNMFPAAQLRSPSPARAQVISPGPAREQVISPGNTNDCELLVESNGLVEKWFMKERTIGHLCMGCAGLCRLQYSVDWDEFLTPASSRRATGPVRVRVFNPH